MSEWQSVLKSTSVKKQSDSDKILEEMGKLIADYQKEQKTNQPTTATQPTQPGNSGSYGFGNAGATMPGSSIGGGAGGAGEIVFRYLRL